MKNSYDKARGQIILSALMAGLTPPPAVSQPTKPEQPKAEKLARLTKAQKKRERKAAKRLRDHLRSTETKYDE